MRASRVKVDQVELQVLDTEEDAVPIIFLHFSSANLMMWQPSIPYFKNQYRLVLVDLRGHGKSSIPVAGYHIDDMASDIAGVIQQLGLGSVHVVGSSLGAEVGLSLAVHYPDLVRSLVCDGALSSEYGPYGTWEGTQQEFEHHVTSQLDKMSAAPERTYTSLDTLVAKSRDALDGIGWWNEAVEVMERYGAHQLDDGSYTKSFMKPARIEYMRSYFHSRFEDYYSKIRCPLLVLPGEDVFENEREKSAMQGLCMLAPRAQIVAVPGWVHPYGWLLNPVGACQAILDFLRHQAVSPV